MPSQPTCPAGSSLPSASSTATLVNRYGRPTQRPYLSVSVVWVMWNIEWPISLEPSPSMNTDPGTRVTP